MGALGVKTLCRLQSMQGKAERIYIYIYIWVSLLIFFKY